ncbi:MAG: hypothetical protein O3C39_02270, partial [Planctomycetota bacterium]|nr:hypothetical protein [Planctomycetota bacterium]
PGSNGIPHRCGSGSSSCSTIPTADAAAKLMAEASLDGLSFLPDEPCDHSVLRRNMSCSSPTA